MVGGLSFRVLCSPVGSRASAVSLTFIAKEKSERWERAAVFTPTYLVRSCRTVARGVRRRLVTCVIQKADMDEEERKARDQQLRSSIHTKLIESGEYDK